MFTSTFGCSWWCRLAALAVFIVGVVLLPLRTAAAMVPTLVAYDAAFRPYGAPR